MRVRKFAAATLTATLTLAGLLALPAVPAGAVASGANGLVAFTSNRTGTRQVFVMQANGTGALQLTSLGENLDPSVSASGLKIVFISTRDGKNEVYTMNIDGSTQTRITNNNITETHPVWAPNGTLIAFAGANGTDSDIYTIPSGGGLLTDLTPATPTFIDADPSWSPGGITLAFDSTNRQGDGKTNVYTVIKDGTGLTQITTTGSDSNPSWSPDNKNLVFESKRDNPTSGPSVFASVSGPVGIAFSGTSMLVTQRMKDKVLSVSSSGVVSTFATLPSTGNADLERYLAVSPGLGGFPTGDVYVTVRQTIYQITPDGSTVSTFATIPDLPSANNTIAFDAVGTFGNDMLIAGGKKATLYRVHSDGTWSLIRNMNAVAQELEDPTVAPLDYAPYGGDVLVTSKFDNTVFAIAPDGSYSVVGTWNYADEVVFIPPTLCTYGPSTGTLFLAMEDMNQIYKFGAGDLTGLSGALIDGETTSDLGLFSSVNGAISISQFWGSIGTGQLEGTSFAPCNPNNPPATTGGSSNIHEIYKMTSTGANQVRLTTNTFDDTRPAWAPNGTSIVYQSDRDDPNQPACEDAGTCVNEIYSMSALDGSGQTNISNDVAANDSAPDWETVSFVDNVADFAFSPTILKPKLGGAVLWTFAGPSDHTATDNSGMGLFDSDAKSVGSSYLFQFLAAGSYPIFCELHPAMTATVRVPMTVTPSSGSLTTVFTATWAAGPAPAGYAYDVQISRPGGGGFVDWRPGTLLKTASFTPDGGAGNYQFQARLRNTANGFATGYSVPVTITVTA